MTHTQGQSYTHHLKEEEIELLGRLLGYPVVKLYTPALDVCRLWYAAPSFSLPLGGEYLVIESTWQETPEELLDYASMRISRGEHPKDVPEARYHDGSMVIGHPVSTVRVSDSKVPIASIEVFEHEEAGTRERARYDSGLVFKFEDGGGFALATTQSILGGLECSTDEAAIKKGLVEKCRVRMTLD